MSILPKIKTIVLGNWEVVLCFILFALLLFRNPFSIRTQIANFAPAPDAFYYIVPSRSLVEGKGLVMSREGRTFAPVVPPLYSLILAPIFLIKDDPRMFYFMNVLLAFLTLAVFYIIVTNLFPKQRKLRFLLIFLFATNSLIYWYPQLAMAENLGTLLFLTGLWLLILRITPRRAALMGVIAVFLYATKYANLPLTVTFILLYLFRLVFPWEKFKDNLRVMTMLFTASLATFLTFGFFELWVQKTPIFFHPFNTLFGFIKQSLSRLSSTSSSTSEVSMDSGFSWFSFKYVRHNLPFYFDLLLGKPSIILWDVKIFLQPVFAFLSWLGIIVGLRYKKRFIAISLVLLVLSEVSFLSTFYSIDGRYVIHVIPCLLLGLGLLLSFLTANIKPRWLMKVVILGLILYALATSVIRLKKDIMLNLKYAESPWWYIAVLELNKTIDAQIILLNGQKGVKEPIVITPLYPFLVDFFSNGKYRLLPLSSQQEFRSFKTEVWGNYNYDDLDSVYLSLIQQGYPVYMANYGIGHEDILISSFAHLQDIFDLELVSSGCYNLCNVYRVWPIRKQLNSKGLK